MQHSVLLVGGARSGKSSAGQAMAGSGPVTMVVTAEPLDDEMARRIERHRQDRPAQWTTVEAPHDLAAAVAAVADDATLLVDCLTLWVSNRLLLDVPAARIEAEATEIGGLLAARVGRSIVIGNEVGQGIVPADPLSRAFRDVHGRVNQIIARHVTTTYLVVAGRLVPTLDAAGLIATSADRP